MLDCNDGKLPKLARTQNSRPEGRLFALLDVPGGA